ncbi:class I SAM-dependent methyltransferase [Rubrobacter indicoceani]|uniref:class I SAM-dependent methyltransferase n=1 Tax=Rubrobacter indicoceani TaxID=2051957 RepID=UPI000E5A5769|nr:methyltransferase domain-containing protein [Rubrobacter indicoceani]
MSLEWNAVFYERLADPMTRWGEAFLDRVELRGDEYVLDAGCGTGRVTEKLLERLPNGRVLAVDGSGAMVEAARERFAGDDRVSFLRRDLLELRVAEPVDLIFSTATFHWIPAHDRLFARLFDALKPGGRLAAQCGGEGNISRVDEATRRVMEQERFAPYFEGWTDEKLYAGAEDTERRLVEAGFEGAGAWLQPEPTPFAGVEHLADYLRTIILRSHVLVLPEEPDRDAFARAVALEMDGRDGPLLADYVRINLLARKPVQTASQQMINT